MARIIEVGSMKEDLHSFALEIFHICLSHGISLELEWIPRELNEAADLSSRKAAIVDTDDWMLTQNFFDLLDRRFGPFSVDCFANYHNKKCTKFYSLFHSPGAAGVDAFTYNWEGENCLLVPPVSIVSRVLKHLKTCKAKGTLVAPYWSSASFWPLLKREFSHYVKDFLIVKGNKVLRQGFNENSLLGSENFEGNMLAVCLDLTELS